MKNKVKDLWASGKPVIGGWLAIPDPFSAEIMAAQGFDNLTIDIQHGLIDYPDAVVMLQAIKGSGVTPFVRVPWLDPGMIMKVLDAGAMGIICPMINNRAQAEELVSCMRYPPQGKRSFGPIRAAMVEGPDYFARANDHVLCIAMIETAEAMDNLDEIVSTPGLDAVYVGPADLSLGISNGRLAPGFDREEPEVVAAFQKIIAASKKAGIHCCQYCNDPQYAAKAIAWGFDFITIANDVSVLGDAAAAKLAQMKALVK